jgi:hypothetical protein
MTWLTTCMKETEFTVKNLPTQKTPVWDDYTGKYYKTLRKHMNFIQTHAESRRETLIHSMRQALPWYQNLTMWQKSCKSVSLTNTDAQIPNKIFANWVK